MNAFDIVGGILLILTCITVVFLVASQESSQKGMGALTGDNSSESFFSKSKGRTLDSMLKRWTKVAAIVFMALTLIVNAITIWVK